MAAMLFWLPPMAVTTASLGDAAAVIAATDHGHMHDDEDSGKGDHFPAGHSHEHVMDHSHEAGGAIELPVVQPRALSRQWQSAGHTVSDLMAVFLLERPPRALTTN